MGRTRRSLTVAVVAGALTAAGVAVITGPAVAGGPGGRGPMRSSDPTAPLPGGGTGMGMGGMMMTSVADEADYLVQMIPHHEEAIETARELARSSRPEMRRFGEDIVRTQSAEVAQLTRWLDTWYTGVDRTSSYHPMMHDLSGLSGDALDRTFLEDMVPHHMMAVMMSRQLQMRGLVVHPEVGPFARHIADVQMAEIHQMRGWLATWFGAGGMGHGPMGGGMRGGMGRR